MGGLFSEIGGVTGGAGAEALAFAAGFAAGRALEPAGVTIAQDAWHAAQVRRLNAEVAAQIAAEGFLDVATMAEEASYNGYEKSRFQSLYEITLTAPGLGELYRLWRRDEISDDDFAFGLRKAKFGARWDAPLRALKIDRLDPAIIATAIQRGIMQAPFALPYSVDVPVGNVEPFPTSTLDTAKEAAASGIDLERLRVQTALVGLPMALDRAARARFRNILTDGDYLRAVLEGNARGEWAAAELEVAREILTSHDYTELQLRGFYGRDERIKNTAKHGMSEADSDLLFDVIGRAPSVHTIVVGIARGGKYPGSYANVPEPYRSAIQRSNIREEWCEIVYAARFGYPSPFVLKSLAIAGDLGNSEAVEKILLEIGWKPELAATVAPKWVPAGSKGDPHVTKAQTQLWATIHKSYVAQESGPPEAESALTALGVAPEAHAEVLALWDHERRIVREALSPTQIKKAIGQPGKDHAWALERLQDRGWSTDDADTFLKE